MVDDLFVMRLLGVMNLFERRNLSDKDLLLSQIKTIVGGFMGAAESS